MREDFGAFILTHGRPDRVITLRSLERSGYTGKVFLVIDDQDKTGPEYHRKYGNRVLVFSKEEVAKATDQYDNTDKRCSILWARNACWDLARQVGLRYFVQLDDDYNSFLYRRAGRKEGAAEATYHGWTIRSLDAVFEALVRFLETTTTRCIAMSQGGDHFGGAEGKTAIRLIRKAMNSFVCALDRPVRFLGRMNEDVNTYVTRGARGELFFTHMPLQLNQAATQSSPGGITEMYLESGTYVKSCYTVMSAPSCVTIRTMGRTSRRLHHHIDWSRAVPKIVSEETRNLGRS